MDAIETEESLKIYNEEHYEGKLYECKNFEYPFIEILKNETRDEYYLSFLDENYRTEKQRVHVDQIPEDVLKLFNLGYEESFKGLLTEITCIQCIKV